MTPPHSSTAARLLAVLLAVSAAATTGASQADLVNTALRMHAESTVLPTHLLDDPHMFHGRHLLAEPRRLQALQSTGRYVVIRNPTMAGEAADCGGAGDWGTARTTPGPGAGAVRRQLPRLAEPAHCAAAWRRRAAPQTAAAAPAR